MRTVGMSTNCYCLMTVIKKNILCAEDCCFDGMRAVLCSSFCSILIMTTGTRSQHVWVELKCHRFQCSSFMAPVIHLRSLPAQKTFESCKYIQNVDIFEQPVSLSKRCASHSHALRSHTQLEHLPPMLDIKGAIDAFAHGHCRRSSIMHRTLIWYSQAFRIFIKIYRITVQSNFISSDLIN